MGVSWYGSEYCFLFLLSEELAMLFIDKKNPSPSLLNRSQSSRLNFWREGGMRGTGHP